MLLCLDGIGKSEEETLGAWAWTIHSWDWTGDDAKGKGGRVFPRVGKTRGQSEDIFNSFAFSVVFYSYHILTLETQMQVTV